MRRLSLLSLAVFGLLSAFAMFDSTIGVAPKTLIAAVFFAVAALILAILSRHEPLPSNNPRD